MYPNSRKEIQVGPAEDSSHTEAWLFAQEILGRPIPRPPSAAAARRDREQLEWLASISDRHAAELSRLRGAEAEARHQRAMLEWLATISDRHAAELRRLQAAEAEAREGNSLGQCHGNGSLVNEAWVPSQHPRLGGPPNAGYFASTGGSAGSMVPASTALAGVEADPDDDGSELTVTPSMVRASGWLGSVREKMRLARDVAGAFAAGLGTGAKAVVNGLATGARSVATLGLNTDQLELIGVTKEDRERGYDTAVTISTGSGQLLIAVGTGGMIARAASGALIAYDAAGNAVGVCKAY